MSAFYNDGPFTMESGEDLEADRIAKISSDTAKYADAGEDGIGITTCNVLSGANVSLRVMDGSVRKVTGSKAIASGAAIYVTTDGKVSDAAVGNQIGIMLEAITADGGKAAAIVWGTRMGQDSLSSKGGTIEYLDDFFSYDPTATVGDYANVSDGSPAVDVGDAHGGVLSIATGATDENETYISTLHELFLFGTTKKLFFEARVKLTEANTDDANIIIGLSDTVGADTLQDAGAGPAASFDGAVLFKVDGGTVWQGMTSNAASQETDTDVGAFTDGAWTKLGIVYDFNDGVTASVEFFVDGVSGGSLDLVISGLAEMHILLGAKAGGSNAETLLVDYVQCSVER